jgi:nucleoside-diphosphate-sugar epimerase
MDNFLWHAHHRMPIIVHQGAVRSWCHVTDTVRGLRYILEDADRTPDYEAWNVGRADVPLSMHALAVKACELTGCPLNLIKLVDPPAMQTVVKNLNCDRLAMLGWKPQVDLDEGIEGVLEWVRNFDAEGNWLGAEEVA